MDLWTFPTLKSTPQSNPNFPTPKPTHIDRSEAFLRLSSSKLICPKVPNTRTVMSKFDPYAHLDIAIGPDDIVTRRLKFPTIKANLNVDPGDPTVSKDLIINVETKTWVRVFLPTKLPSNDNIVARLPIIVYFHHGGWVLFGADDSYTRKECSRIASNIPAIVISVNYRLAPENRLPAQYHDALDAICWVKNQATNPKGEEWLRDYGDFSRCYLYVCGNGGNMVFFVGIKACASQLEPMNFAGMIMNQPLFGGEERTKSELNYATDEILPLPVLDLMWDLALPKGVDRNYWYCNPMMVMGSYGDPTIDRQQEFVTMLATCGVHVKTWFDDVGSHNAHLWDSRRATQPKYTSRIHSWTLASFPLMSYFQFFLRNDDVY